MFICFLYEVLVIFPFIHYCISRFQDLYFYCIIKVVFVWKGFGFIGLVVYFIMRFIIALISHVFFSPQAGVSKLNEAKQLVDELKRKANDQSILLAEKQSEADSALKEITTAMQVQYAKICLSPPPPPPLPSDSNMIWCCLS